MTTTDAAVDGDLTVCFARCSMMGSVAVRGVVSRAVTATPWSARLLMCRWFCIPCDCDCGCGCRRYRCANAACQREVFAHNTDRLARRGWSTTRRCARYILRRLMIDRTTVAAVGRGLGLSWDTVNTIAVDATQMIVVADTTRLHLDGVWVIGVDEHRWVHTRHAVGDGFGTVIIDLTPVLDSTGPARLLDLVAGR
ncbi:hypothetical protein [Mycobacterium marinum]|uniref:hypothetical protein n=1 Tax=Mycobacterium marinum TaxID=1781 RepID=UPI001CA56E42|nr:hypothetical protein [Mycobacterium marinum]